MADEPRRSVRANKGQHKNASSSPAPNPKAAKAAKGKTTKKTTEPEVEAEDDEEDEEIRCICGNTNRKDKRPFIACDACSVWQHNVCMGIPDDEDDVPEHYFCEECRPEEHQETLQALKRGEKIWEVRNKIYQTERRTSKSRKNRGKQGDDSTPGWLKKDVPAEETQPSAETQESPQKTAEPQQVVETGSKRKREDIKEEKPQEDPEEVDDKPVRPGRQDKRRKSSSNVEEQTATDSDTALLEINQLPADRKKVASALSQIISSDVQERTKNSAFKIPENHTAKSIGDYYAVRIEYSLQMNHGGTKEASYMTQFRALHANLKKNRSLVERLLSRALTPDQLSLMSTSDMASEELRRERAELKEVLDRQAVAVTEEGPRYRQDHKGYHAIEDESKDVPDTRVPTPQPPTARPGTKDGQRQSESQEPGEASRSADPPTNDPTQPNTSATEQQTGQQFDMNNIWAKTAQSPTAASPQAGSKAKPPPRRSNSVQISSIAQAGAKDDPDVDRMLEDNDEPYSPAAATGADAIVWRGKLIQNSEEEAPVLNARFVAGRDLVASISWQDLLPASLSIDGRLQIQKAEDYLCGLRWSSSSDVSVLSLTPYDNREAFNKIFDYFHSRQRYAVVEKGKPPLVRELYIIPVDVGAKLPEHIEMLEHCTIKKPVEERLLLASLTVTRAPDEALSAQADGTAPIQLAQAGTNGNLPQHVRQSISGPAGSPIGNQTPFSPSQAGQPPVGYAISANVQPASYAPQHPFPPNPYGAPSQANAAYSLPQQQKLGPNPRVNEILGDLQFTPSAMQILQASPNMSDQQLQGLRTVLLENPHSRNDLTALTAILHS